jgi:hypothetical protein
MRAVRPIATKWFAVASDTAPTSAPVAYPSRRRNQ